MHHILQKIVARAAGAWRSRVILGIAIPIFGLALYGIYTGIVAPRIERSRLIALAVNDATLRAQAERAEHWESTYAREPMNVEAYLAAGLNWKSIGDATGNRGFYALARASYEDGIRNVGGVNTFLYANAGNMHRALGDFKRAERRYKDAIEKSKGSEYSFFLHLIELYRFDLRKTPEEVLAVFEDGLRRLYGSTPLLIERASYFESLGRIEDALHDYEKLAAVFPHEPLYRETVITLRAQLGSKR